MCLSAFWVYTRTTVDTYVVARVFLFCPSSQYPPVVSQLPPDEDRTFMTRDVKGAISGPTVGEASKKFRGFEDLNGKRREEPAVATIPTLSA